VSSEQTVPDKKEDILIVKGDKMREKLNFKVRPKMTRGYSSDSYVKVLNPKDYNDLAVLFEDLDLIIGAPVEKAYKKYKQNKGDGFPFF